MLKNSLIIIILGALLAALPASAKVQDNSFWAAISKLVQEFAPGEEETLLEKGEADEDFVDPRQVQDVLKQIKDLRKELNRLAKQAKKLSNAGEIQNDISALLEKLSGFQTDIEDGVEVRSALQDFWDEQVWEQLNPIRARIEIPTQMKQMEREIKKLEKISSQKKYQNLELNLDGVRTRVNEARQGISRISELYNAGEFSDAMEEFNALREEFSPWDISNVIQRTQEVFSKLRSIKNAEIREQIKQIWAEVIVNFNDGEYRVAWELMNEAQQQVWTLISQALSVGKKKGQSRESFIRKTDQLQEQMKSKAEEKREKFQEIREKREETGQPGAQNQLPPPQPVPETVQQAVP